MSTGPQVLTPDPADRAPIPGEQGREPVVDMGAHSETPSDGPGRPRRAHHLRSGLVGSLPRGEGGCTRILVVPEPTSLFRGPAGSAGQIGRLLEHQGVVDAATVDRASKQRDDSVGVWVEPVEEARGLVSGPRD